jgi:hypothetical protein
MSVERDINCDDMKVREDLDVPIYVVLPSSQPEGSLGLFQTNLVYSTGTTWRNVNGTSLVGPQGTQGFQGFQGPVGGAQGFIGSQGSQGFQGSQGNQGSSVGLQGFQGFVGSQGSQGNQGAQGILSAPGAQGFSGNQGVQGTLVTGAQGAQGLPGTGFQGAQGSPGNQGAQGPPGIQGQNGSQGAQGFQGFQGQNGLSGTQGALGPPSGTQGSQGNQGSPGGVGAQGTNVNSTSVNYTYTMANQAGANTTVLATILRYGNYRVLQFTPAGDFAILQNAPIVTLSVSPGFSGTDAPINNNVFFSLYGTFGNTASPYGPYMGTLATNGNLTFFNTNPNSNGSNSGQFKTSDSGSMSFFSHSFSASYLTNVSN